MPVKTRLVAIINLTPDSFSDGGKYFAPDSAIAAIKQAMSDGADVIDIGAESTRPGAIPISHTEEWRRLAPVLEYLSKYPMGSIEISIDTRHAETAKKALKLGVHWINDVSGFDNAEMIEVVKNSGCKLVVMHSLTVPADKNIVLPDNIDVVQHIIDWANERFAMLEDSGIIRSRLIFDSGIGFGKTSVQSQEILKRVSEYRVLNVPIYIGHSRKSFLRKTETIAEKDSATLEVSRELVAHDVDYIRVHNVKLHRKMLLEMAHVA